MGARDPSERVVAINWNEWSRSIGIAGRDQPVRALHGGDGAEQAGFPHDCEVPTAASEGAGRSVRAGAQVVPGGRAGEARSRVARRHEGSSQCQPAQGDVLRPHARGGEEGRRGSGGVVCAGGGMRREEDREHGAERRGDEMPDWVADKMARLSAFARRRRRWRLKPRRRRLLPMTTGRARRRA
jgi:hypothetical protein